MIKRILTYLILSCCLRICAQIAVYGDTRTQHDIHREIVAQMANHSFHTVFHTGDLVQQGLRQSEYDNFFQIIDPLIQTATLYPARGNHEKNKDLFLANFPYLADRYYSVVADSILWIVLDSNERLSPGSGQYQWLLQQLEDTRLPIFIMLHHPIFSSGKHGNAPGLGLFLPSLFERYHVKAVFAGHDHCYERSLFKGIHYITTGGGGAPLYDKSSRNDHSQIFIKEHHFCILNRIDPKQILVNVHDRRNRILDSFTISLD